MNFRKNINILWLVALFLDRKMGSGPKLTVPNKRNKNDSTIAKEEEEEEEDKEEEKGETKKISPLF